MIPLNVETLLLNVISSYTGQDEMIKNFSSISGGSINNAFKVETSSNVYFVKWNQARKYPGMFEKEARGLELLKNANEIFIPAVIGCDFDHDFSIIVLEYVEPAREVKSFWEDFGGSLARLHKHTDENFGLDHDNYIGSLEQYNSYHNNWIEFFINQRLAIQIKMARDKGLIDKAMIMKFEKMYHHLTDFFPVEKPSLIHGDLWSGNFMTNAMGEPCILDPAVHYGHRLMDIGMSMLFGGFTPEFYDSYNRTFPMESNWRKSVEIANLYPLMVHVNLFGAGYTGSVRSILSGF